MVELPLGSQTVVTYIDFVTYTEITQFTTKSSNTLERQAVKDIGRRSPSSKTG